MRFSVVFMLGVLLLLASNAAAEDALLSNRVAALEDSLQHSFFNKVDLSGLIEVEAGYRSGFDDAKESDVDMTNVELGLEVELTGFASAFVLAKWEEDGGEGVFIDEGGIVLGNLEQSGFSVSVGKLYVPFGVFETAMVSDPLTLELGETREGAVTVDVAGGGFYGSVYAFNSAVGDSKDDDMLDAYGLKAGYAFEGSVVTADLSVGYISNLTSSGGFSDYLADEGIDLVDEYSAGVTASAVVSVADVTLIGEYLAAVDNDYLAGADDQPEAWNLELDYNFTLSGQPTVLAVAYQGTAEAAFLGLPELRVLAALSYEIAPGLGVALEVSHDEDYDQADGGSGETADAVICQLAVEF